MLTYNEYVNKIKDYQEKSDTLKYKYKEQVKKDLNSELSKYLIPTTLEDWDKWIKNFDGNGDRFNYDDKVFLLDEMSGIVCGEPFDTHNDDFLCVNVYHMFKYAYGVKTPPGKETGKWKVIEKFMFNSKHDNVNDFVLKIVESLKIKSKKEKEAREKRKLKRDVKKYNL